MAGLIVMQPLGATKARNFNRLMADAGSHEILGIEYPKMQMLSVGEILDGKRFKRGSGYGLDIQSVVTIPVGLLGSPPALRATWMLPQFGQAGVLCQRTRSRYSHAVAYIVEAFCKYNARKDDDNFDAFIRGTVAA